MDGYKEVYFDKYCLTCKYEDYDESKPESPCCECLTETVNLYSHKPVLWLGKKGYENYIPPAENVKNIFNEKLDYSGKKLNYTLDRHISKWFLLTDTDLNGAYSKSLLILKPEECAGKTLWCKTRQTETRANGGFMLKDIQIFTWDGLKEYNIGSMGLTSNVSSFTFPKNFNKLIKNIHLKLWIRPVENYGNLKKGSSVYANRIMMSWDEITKEDLWRPYNS